MSEICEISELPTIMCAHCRGVKLGDEPDADEEFYRGLQNLQVRGSDPAPDSGS